MTTPVCVSAFGFRTAAWTRSAESARLTSLPLILLASVGPMTATLPGLDGRRGHPRPALDALGAPHVTATRIPITGVRGRTGAPLAGRLAGRAGVEVLGGSSDPSTVAVDGIRPAALSWDDRAGCPGATEDVDAVYADRADAPELIPALVAGTQADAHVVLLPGPEERTKLLGRPPCGCPAWLRAGRGTRPLCLTPRKRRPAGPVCRSARWRRWESPWLWCCPAC